ncbi:MAG: NGG1p interacting factor NIF3 [Candidatus Diapherotrites archaeon]
MKLKELHELAVKEGMNADPRGPKEVERKLKKLNEKFKELKKDEQDEFDRETLWNPYSDSRILNGSGNEEVKTVLVGIDLEVPEIVLADRLKEKGKKIDALIAHHPEGKALASLYAVMDLQNDVLAKFGVPINVAEGVMGERISEVMRSLSPINHTRAEDSAKLLGIPMVCLHTVADNHVQKFVQEFVDEKKPETLRELLKALKELPEYKNAMKWDAGPKIFAGKKDNRCGKIFVNMTGGTEGSEKNYEKLAIAGVGTTVEMHVSEKLRAEAEKNHINVVIAGHISSDTIGLNLLLDKIEKKLGKLEVIECSGFRRVKR